MTDTIIKGSGNSRTLKTVPNIKSMVSSLDDLLDLFIAGFPVDVGPLNQAGVEQIGTGYTKAEVLTDALCSALGLSTTATPNQALDKLRQLVNAAQSTANGNAKIQAGYYTGTNTGGSSNPNYLTFSFNPKLVMIVVIGTQLVASLSSQYWAVQTDALTSTYTENMGFGTIDSYQRPYGKKVGNTIYWYHPNARSSYGGPQYNASGVKYYYIAIG